MDKVRVLLVDDKPGSAFDEDGRFRILDPQLSPYFDALWLKTISDARMYLDGFSLLDRTDPGVLGRAGLVPEMLIFDYSLGEGGFDDADDNDAFATFHLKRALEAAGLPVPRNRVDRAFWKPGHRDAFGCYIGVTLARAFGAHPCSAVPTTTMISASEISPDALFVEWLNAADFAVPAADETMFDNRFGNRTFRDLIPMASANLRRRFAALCGAGIITPSLHSLFALQDEAGLPREGAELERMLIRFESRYGVRTLPLAGFFADDLVKDGLERVKVAAWGRDVLNALRVRSSPLLHDAAALAKRYVNLGDSDLCDARYTFSSCVARKATTGGYIGEPKALQDLERVMGITIDEAVQHPFDVTPRPDMVVEQLASKKHHEGVDAVRLATLFLLVHVAAADAASDHHDGDDSFGEWREFLGHAVNASELALDELRKMYKTQPRAREAYRTFDTFLDAMTEGGYKRRQRNGSEYLVRPGVYTFKDRLYRYLDPLPQTLLTFEHKKATKDKEPKWSPDPTHIYNQLRRVLNLDIGHVLDGWHHHEIEPTLADIDVVPGARFQVATDDGGGTQVHHATVVRVATDDGLGSDTSDSSDTTEDHPNNARRASSRVTLDVLGRCVDVRRVPLNKTKDKVSVHASSLTQIAAAATRELHRTVRFHSIFGLRPGEGSLMRAYAVSLGFDRGAWPSWLKTRR